MLVARGPSPSVEGDSPVWAVSSSSGKFWSLDELVRSDHFASRVKQRSTAAAGRDGRSYLQILVTVLLNRTDSADYTIRDRRFERERIADGNNFFAYLYSV